MTSINDLQNDHKNARKRTDRSSKLIKESLQKFGAARSIVIDENNRILAGNGTIAGAKAAGIKNLKVIETDGNEIIAVKRTGLSEDEKVGLALADNRTSDLSEWDINMLEELSQEHDLNPWFDNDDLKELLGETEVLPAEGLTDPDDVPEVPEEPVTKEGDLYILGNHRLLCGDSTNILHVEKLMDGNKADMVFTDPPYGMGLDTDYTKMPIAPNGATPLKHNKGLVDDFKPEMINIIISLQCDETFIFGADYFAEYLPEKNKGSWIVWDKRVTENFDRMIGSSFELCWSKSKHKREIARFNNTLFSGESDAKNKVHPTQKPIKLIEWFIDKYSDSNHKIVDLFGGSGSTLIAAERANRHAYLMELDTRYCDVIVKRWEDFTGNTAKRVSSS
jgi:DNA modification methylase